MGVPILRIIVYWGLYWGPPILGNYHIGTILWGLYWDYCGDPLPYSPASTSKASMGAKARSSTTVGPMTSASEAFLCFCYPRAMQVSEILSRVTTMLCFGKLAHPVIQGRPQRQVIRGLPGWNTRTERKLLNSETPKYLCK